jgi:hypothetical protein
MAETFDVLFPAELTGEITKFEITDPDDTPNRVLEITRDWKIDLEWKIEGNVADTLGGSWHVQVSLESMGEGYEGPVGEEVVVEYHDFDPTSTPTKCIWKPTSIVVTAVEMAGNPEIVPGVYKPIVLITYKNEDGQNRPMAGFMDAGLITLFEPD